MRAPAFWERDSALARALSPLSMLWRLGAAVRRATVRGETPSIPVLCVGNLVAGGAGKTPIAIDLVRRMAPMGAHALGTGYGGCERGPLRVAPARHDARAVGDEALLLAQVAPAWIARDRRAGVRAAAAAGAKLVVMDDGFQYPGLAQRHAILVFDGAYGIGNGRVMPAGPLREPFAAGLARADAAVVMGEDRAGIARRIGDRLPVLRARLVPGPGARHLTGTRVFAVSGIGRPAKFRATLEAMGCTIAGAREFPDHHVFTEDEAMEACEAASALGARPVTTAKDHVRLPAPARAMIEAVPVEVAWEDEAALGALLSRLGR